jgi:tetratricopeptide (TPR) repeat protein
MVAARASRAFQQQSAVLSTEQVAEPQSALALLQQGRLEEAEDILRRLIDSGSSNYLDYANLAGICGLQGRLPELIELLRKALVLHPDFPEAYNNLGNALKELGDIPAAIDSYQKALALNPALADVHYNLGIAFLEQGDFPGAIASFQHALDLNPRFAAAHCNRGSAYVELGDLDAAIASFRHALEIDPDYLEALVNLGMLSHGQGDLSVAKDVYQKAVQLHPEVPELHYTLGSVFYGLAELPRACACFQSALELRPDYTEAQLALAMVDLIRGDYAQGWQRYEHRLLIAKDPPLCEGKPPCSLWQGQPLQAGDRLLLVCEQGLDDTFQFMRYAIALRNRGVEVSLCAPAHLHSLIQASGIDPSPLTPEQASQVQKGLWIPLLSVPRHLGITPDNPIITEPYIQPGQTLVSKWHKILAPEQRPLIAIHWQGNPAIALGDFFGRSLPLEIFAPMAAHPGLSLLSLQKGVGSEQMESCSFQDRFVHCQDQINQLWDLEETAAIIANCDLVITGDTAMAHLAGGMGKTTWLLLQQTPDWRWGLQGETTFWYPSLRLFRQHVPGDWKEVMERVVSALQQRFAVRPPASPPVSPSPSTARHDRSQAILAPVSLGELIDKITILQIKTHFLDGHARQNAHAELTALEQTLTSLHIPIDPSLVQRLKEVNQNLWQTEDAIRDQERQKTFGETFIHLARSVYQLNDRRSAIKKEINLTYGSALVEEKSYQPY